MHLLLLKLVLHRQNILSKLHNHPVMLLELDLLKQQDHWFKPLNLLLNRQYKLINKLVQQQHNLRSESSFFAL